MDKNTQASAVIIGAGLAGLTAARRLDAAGWRTTVLEARERVGGRVFTVREGFREGQMAEGGGEFIEDFHHRMLGLAQAFGLELVPLKGMESWDHFLALDGKAGPGDDISLWGIDLIAEGERLWRAVAELGPAVPDAGMPQEAPDAAAIDRRTVAEWLETLDVHPLAKAVFRSRVRSEYTIEPEEMSLLDLSRWAAFYYSEEEGGRQAFRIRGGNDQIPRRMAAELPDVRTQAEVPAVRRQAGRVAVDYRTPGGDSVRIEADYAVIAVPFGPLRRIAFEPVLPEELQRVIAGLTYGVVTKVMIQYSCKLSELGWSGRVLTDLPITCTWPSGEGLPGSHDLVTVYTGAEAGKVFTGLDEEVRIREAIAQVEQVCPGSAERVVSARTIAWANEPFTGGSYAAFKPGEVTGFWQALRDRVGPLVFAGEHIAMHQGYMEGAVESGERAASLLLVGRSLGS